MPIFNMLWVKTEAEALAEAARIGAVNVRDASFDQSDGRHTMFLADTYTGQCIAERERNMHDDSDFYMTVWAEDAVNGGRAIEICFASTRGWSYPAMGSYVDATPEVLAKYAAWKQEQARLAELRRARVEAVTPRKGRTVRVIAGRKVPKGTEAVVFWERIEKVGFFTYPEDRYYPATGRIGLEVPGVGRVFVGADQVEVVGTAEVSVYAKAGQ